MPPPPARRRYIKMPIPSFPFSFFSADSRRRSCSRRPRPTGASAPELPPVDAAPLRVVADHAGGPAALFEVDALRRSDAHVAFRWAVRLLAQKAATLVAEQQALLRSRAILVLVALHRGLALVAPPACRAAARYAAGASDALSLGLNLAGVAAVVARLRVGVVRLVALELGALGGARRQRRALLVRVAKGADGAGPGGRHAALLAAAAADAAPRCDAPL